MRLFATIDHATLGGLAALFITIGVVLFIAWLKGGNWPDRMA